MSLWMSRDSPGCPPPAAQAGGKAKITHSSDQKYGVICFLLAEWGRGAAHFLPQQTASLGKSSLLSPFLSFHPILPILNITS